MPLYEFLCNKDHRFDLILKIADYNTPQKCPECNAVAKRQITATMIAPEFESYESPIDGSPITTKQKRLEEMARNDCVPYESSMKEESTKRIKRSEVAMDKSVDKTVDKIWDGLSSQKRENLAREICSGADVNYLRQ